MAWNSPNHPIRVHPKGIQQHCANRVPFSLLAYAIKNVDPIENFYREGGSP